MQHPEILFESGSSEIQIPEVHSGWVPFPGTKEIKKKDSKSSGNGHLGCSNSYNFMEYKKFTSNDKDGASNYQGREQLHSILKPLAPALRQMSYPNFMRTLIIFFGIRNLITMKKLKNSDLDF